MKNITYKVTREELATPENKRYYAIGAKVFPNSVVVSRTLIDADMTSSCLSSSSPYWDCDEDVLIVTLEQTLPLDIVLNNLFIELEDYPVWKSVNEIEGELKPLEAFNEMFKDKHFKAEYNDEWLKMSFNRLAFNGKIYPTEKAIRVREGNRAEEFIKYALELDTQN